jgi:hypothetical protein
VRCGAGCWELGRGRARGCAVLAAGTGSTSSSGRQMGRGMDVMHRWQWSDSGPRDSLAARHDSTQQSSTVEQRRDHPARPCGPYGPYGPYGALQSRRRVRMARALSSLSAHCRLACRPTKAVDRAHQNQHTRHTTHDTHASPAATMQAPPPLPKPSQLGFTMPEPARQACFKPARALAARPRLTPNSATTTTTTTTAIAYSRLSTTYRLSTLV